MKSFILILCALFIGCASPQVLTEPTKEKPLEVPVVKEPEAVKAETVNPCEVVASKETLRDGVFTTPISGKSLIESHLITETDVVKRTKVKSATSGIAEHLKQTCDLLKAYGVSASDCAKIHAPKYSKVWSGTDGHGDNLGVPNRFYLEGSRFKLDLPSEVFMFNMDWFNPLVNGKVTTTMPPQGAKYLLCKGSLCVVAAAGIESGPRIAHARVGTTPEVGYFLKLTNPDRVTVKGRVKDSVPLGPVFCN